jgi:S-adenosylmethionine:tRNA ribosyltransferase-isomerase
MLVSDFHFDLPERLIAQQPPAVRGSSRMLTLDRRSGVFADRMVADLPSLLEPGDLLVMNDSRVLPARLFATRAGLATQHNSPAPSGSIEVLLTEYLANPEGHNDWRALVKPAKKVQPREALLFDRGLRAEVLWSGEYGERTLRFNQTASDFHATLDLIGHLPLPPYIHREKNAPNTAEDRERYQTVYAKERGSAAAPTAGLHFTPEILEALRSRGVELATITLHVGLGTFQPVRAERTEDIRLHAEPYTLPAATADALNAAKREKRRVIAVGTTTTRTLEHIARRARQGTAKSGDEAWAPIEAHSGSTSLFLSPGLDDRFLVVDGLLTNFHLPQSTLLMLVSAFLGGLHGNEPDWGRRAALAAYAHAVDAGYRFFSYGDCMLIV